MFCNNCGREFDDSFEFCPHCGKERHRRRADADSRLAQSEPVLAPPPPAETTKTSRLPHLPHGSLRLVALLMGVIVAAAAIAVPILLKVHNDNRLVTVRSGVEYRCVTCGTIYSRDVEEEAVKNKDKKSYTVETVTEPVRQVRSWPGGLRVQGASIPPRWRSLLRERPGDTDDSR